MEIYMDMCMGVVSEIGHGTGTRIYMFYAGAHQKAGRLTDSRPATSREHAT